ncbi:MAG TPA: FAD-dependent oxidoreductase [Candidatus Acidoferrales bacterium]|nr:FAD-dependent oxidoreductase [Candidatus Acidoferrales bacterium]
MKLNLTAIKSESPDVKSFIFKPSRPLSWKAGQYLHYLLHHEPTDDRGSDRWFTIASAPFERHVMITTRFAKHKGSTFKKTFKALKLGDSIEASDVDGDFIVEDRHKDYVFIAGGIGITPFRSIIKEMQHKRVPLRVTLIYASRNAHVIYQKELETAAKHNPHFSIHYVFSPQRIDRTTIQQLVPNLKKPLFYISGPEPMVESTGKILQKLGVPKTRIKQDWFPGYPAD